MRRTARQYVSVAAALSLAMLASGAFAATYTVGAGGDYATFEDAVAAANTNAGADTLLLLDNYYTSNGAPTVTAETVTIQPAPSNTSTITIEKTTGAGQVIRNTSMSGTISVIGHSPDAPIILRQHSSGSTAPVINTGPDTNTTTNWVLENVVLERLDDDTSNNFFLNFNGKNASPHILRNVKFVGNGPGATTAATPVGVNTVDPPYLTSAVFENCDWSGAGGTGARLQVGFSNVTVRDSIVHSLSGANAPALVQYAAGSVAAPGVTEVTFEDCSFRSGDARLFTTLTWAADITLVDPVFAGKCGDIAFDINTGPVNFAVVGTDPANKVDFDGMTSAGTVLYARLQTGSLSLTNCAGSVRPGAGSIDCAAGDLVGSPVISMDQCDWANGAGDFIGGTSGGAFGITFNANNTVWTGTTPAGHVLAAVGSHTGLSSINLAHCTVAMDTANAFFFGNAGDRVNVTGVVVYTNAITTSHALSSIGIYSPSGVPSVGYADVADDGGGSPFVGNPNLPVSIFVIADPLVDSNGVPQAGSPALGLAVGSSETVDVVGAARPQGDANPDLGAYESAALNDGSNDADGDGLADIDEIAAGTELMDPDTDGDGLSDGDEASIYGTDPLDSDSDDDSVSDGTEVLAGTDPLDANDFPQVPAASTWALALMSATLLACAGGFLLLARRAR